MWYFFHDKCKINIAIAPNELFIDINSEKKSEFWALGDLSTKINMGDPRLLLEVDSH